MRGKKSVFVGAVAILALVLAAQVLPAAAADPLSAECADAGLASLQGIHIPNQPKCSAGPVQCPVDSAGCAFTATIELKSAGGLGASRGLLRLRDPDTGAFTDFYCGGPATECDVIQPTTFFPPGQRIVAICSVTEDNFVIAPTVKCRAAMSPLGGE